MPVVLSARYHRSMSLDQPPFPHPESPDLLRAIGLHRSRRLDEAEIAYRAVLASPSPPFDALHGLGIIRLEKGDPTEATELIQRALAINSGVAPAHSNLGNALKELGRLDEALGCYDRAVELQPDFVEAWFNRGVLLILLGRIPDALSSYDRALSIRPAYVEALNNRGNALSSLGRPDEALDSYDRALRLNPNFSPALSNRGQTLAALQRPQEALASFEEVLKRDPNNVKALAKHGDALQDLGRTAEAVLSYDRALKIRSDLPDVVNNRALALLDLGRHAQAAGAFRQLLALAPGWDYALGFKFHAQLLDCHWEDYHERAEQIAAGVARGERRDAPFSFLVHCGDPGKQRDCARIYAADKYPPAPEPLSSDARYRHDKLRIAYLSSDFHDHPVGHLIADLVDRHDRGRFKLFGFSLAQDRGDLLRERLRRSFDQFATVGSRSDREIAQLLKDNEIDIAIDLNGYTQGRRTGIFSHRGAPLQVNYLGYPGTMGAEYFDYLIADRYVVPPEHEAHYREKIVRLPHAYIAKTRQAVEPPGSRNAYGLPEDAFVFCCFNNSYKIAPEVFDVWMRLLHRVPKSVLWLRDHGSEASRNLAREAERRGISADRLSFVPRVGRPEHLARYGTADLFLDTSPYNAHATALEALSAGLPVVTVSGASFASRVAGSLLHAIGLPQLIADDLTGYEALAFGLAGDRAALAEVRSRLMDNRAHASLFDADRLARHLEAAYLALCERHGRGETPASLDVSPVDRR
jgi:predicted O-linked N-acetylglucosamine transferase (SPINDLY family)